MTVYCITYIQQIYQKAFLNWLCHDLFQYFFNRFCRVKKAFLNWLCQYISFFNIFSIDFDWWKKFFSTDCVNIYLFSIFFLIDFAWWKNVGLPHIAYIMIYYLQSNCKYLLKTQDTPTTIKQKLKSNDIPYLT